MSEHRYNSNQIEKLYSSLSEITERLDLGELEYRDRSPNRNRYDLMMAVGYAGQEILERQPEKKKSGPGKSQLELSISNMGDHLEEFGVYDDEDRFLKLSPLKDMRTIYLEAADYFEKEDDIDFEKESIGFLAKREETMSAFEKELESIGLQLEYQRRKQKIEND